MTTTEPDALAVPARDVVPARRSCRSPSRRRCRGLPLPAVLVGSATRSRRRRGRVAPPRAARRGRTLGHVDTGADLGAVLRRLRGEPHADLTELAAGPEGAPARERGHPSRTPARARRPRGRVQTQRARTRAPRDRRRSRAAFLRLGRHGSASRLPTVAPCPLPGCRCTARALPRRRCASSSSRRHIGECRRSDLPAPSSPTPRRRTAVARAESRPPPRRRGALRRSPGFVMRPTASTGLLVTFFTSRVYSRSHPGSYVIGVWMNEWWTPAETLT